MEHDAGALSAVARFSDAELLAGLSRLVAADRALTTRLIVHLAEVDARGLYRREAYASMFEYAVGALHLSESEAYVRIRAARVARQFPLVLSLLQSNQLHLTAIKLLAPHLTQDNHAEVLARARGLSRSALERLVAELAPKLDVPSRMRLLPEPRNSARPTPHTASAPQPQAQSQPQALPQLQTLPQPQAQASCPEADGGAPRSVPAVAELRLESTTGSTTALSPGRYKVQFTASEALHAKLERLRDLLRHQVPDGDLAVIVERAADLLLDKHLRRRWAQLEPKPRPSVHAQARAVTDSRPARRAAVSSSPQAPPTAGVATACHHSDASPAGLTLPAASAVAVGRGLDAGARAVPSRTTAPTRSRYIPRAVVRAVYERDAQQCTYVSADGRRCAARSKLELHHVDPYARGGAATPDNLRVVCRSHNQLYAEQDYGLGYMRHKLAACRVRQREGSSA